MLNLSKSTVCGIYALHYISKRDRPTTAEEIARFGGLSKTSLAKTLQKLRREGMVCSQRGSGYFLGRPARAITLLEIVTALDGSIRSADLCMMKNPACTFRGTCAVSRMCREIGVSILSALGAISLADLPTGPLNLPICKIERKRSSI